MVRWRWSVHSSETVDVSAEKAVDVRLGIVALESALVRPVSMRGLEPVDEPDFGHDQLYGPMSAWVVTNARALLGLSQVDMLMALMELIAHAEPPAVTQLALQMTAGGTDRSDAYDAAAVLARRVSSKMQSRRDWADEVEHRAEDLGLSLNAAREYLSDHLDAFVEQVLGSCVVEDVMQQALRLQALGAWRCIASPTEGDPGPEWRCNDSTTETLKGFFGEMDEDSLTWILGRIETPADMERDSIQHRLIGSTLIRAASPPPLIEIIGPGLIETLSFRGGRSVIDQMARLVSALCQPPPWLSRDDLLANRQWLSELVSVDWPAEPDASS